MQITNLYSPNFNANLNSRKLRFKQEDFFVRIRGYGKNKRWANEVIKTADTAVNLIRKDTSAENVLKLITAGIRNANELTQEISKKFFTGVLRTPREGWKFGFNCDLTTPYANNKYRPYTDRFDYIAEHPLHEKPIVDISRPVVDKNIKYIFHAPSRHLNETLNKIFALTAEIFPKYIHEEVKPENLADINAAIAEIRWLLAHSTPWMRGSDAISNVFMRSMYKAVGIKSYPLKKGVSLDLEAYCTELKDYKKKFTEYFTKPPEIVD